MDKILVIFKTKFIFLSILYVVAFGINDQAFAEKVKSINTNSFNAGMNSSYLSLEDAYLYDQAFVYKRSARRLFFYGTYTFVNNPWILTNPEGNANVETIISQMQTFDFALGWLLSDSTQLSFDTSFSNVKVASDYGGDSKNHWGDSKVQLKYRLYESEDMAMAIAPELYLPTGVPYVGDTHGGGLSNSSFGFGAKFITEFKFTESRLNLNAGYSFFQNAEIKGSPENEYPQIDGRSRLFLGVGLLSRLSEQWAWDNELTGNLTVKSNNFTPPGEFSSGLRYQTNPDTSWHFGLGSGALKGHGGNDSRLYVGIKTPFFEGQSKEQLQKTDIILENHTPVRVPPIADIEVVPPVEFEPAYVDKPIETPTTSEEILPVIPNIEQKVIYEQEKIEVLEDVSFDLNKSNLTPHGKAVLNQVVKVIKSHISLIDNVNIKGHTDHQGTPKINNPLSVARAKTVRDYLVKNGIPRKVLSAQGYGSQKPIYDFHKTPKKLWEKNRRVEFAIKEKSLVSMRDR